MGNFSSFVRKEALHIVRDKRTLLIVMFIPIMLMVLFGFAISTEVNNVKVAVIATERTDGVNDAVERLAHNDYFTFCGYIAPAEADQKMRSGEVNAVVVFATDYDRRVAQAMAGVPMKPMIQIMVDASNVNIAGAATVYLQNVLLDIGAQQTVFETRMLFNPQMKSAYNFVPGIMGLIFILVCAMMTSVSIVREKEVGTMEVLLVSPMRPASIILAKMVPYFVIACLVLIAVLLLARFILDVPMSGGVLGILTLSMVYVVLSLTLGLLVSTLCRTQVAALLVSAMVLMMPILMLSGMLFPIDNLPEVFRWLSCVVPARWYIDAMRRMMIQGASLMDVWQSVVVLTVMAVLLFVGVIRRFNDRIE